MLHLLLLLFASAPPVPVDIRPAVATEAVASDPDDPAVWVHPSDPARSLILGTNKTAAPAGSLLVFGLDGKLRQEIKPIDRPNNVDVEYGLRLSGRPVDIAILTERLQRRLRVFRVRPDGSGLDDLSPSGIPVFEGQQGENGAPMGVAIYKRPRDGAVFAIVGRKTGPRQGHLWQYRLDGKTGAINAVRVREFGNFSGVGEIEAIAIDDELGYVYYADEGDGIHKWHADPDHPQASRELAHFGRDGFTADREGIAIYAGKGGTGYIICTDQIPGNSQYRVYRREGTPANPHDHSELLKVFRGGADSTDGIEVLSHNLGPGFPHGLMVAMNSSGRNFLLYRWQDIANAGTVKLKLR
jgi:3-phytase